jgi:hypothetical protein
MRTRYTPWARPHVIGGWVLLDWQQMEYCSLPDKDGKSRLLEWNSRAAAEAFLQNCYITWALWEKDGGGKPPEGWRPQPEGPSPYSLGTI